MYRIFAALLFLWTLTLTAAQFPFFDGMFRQQGQQQPNHASGGASQWAAHIDSVQCSQYLCPTTLDCVTRPTQCPCPETEDIKCVIPDSEESESGTVVCVRGPEECEQVERLVKLGK
ncbi:hypothetical protein D9758_004783 [Tetrapyrgos nigripes]|uniref:Long chronological lifespan protein 2 n=1 Tax=Tetrapyrgos nigripes TaxID=182062 RepID=A0A8H5LIZ9_9AGAR|nr:hypothetical protein D9758_004783 [Tetrapyrgos nigripes]